MKQFDEYQEKILTFMNPRVLKSQEETLLNGMMGLNGEAGEGLDILKKHMFHDQPLAEDKLDKEIGDALFYVALAATGRGKKLSEIAQMNVDKLTARYEGKPWTAEASKAKRDELTQKES